MLAGVLAVAGCVEHRPGPFVVQSEDFEDPARHEDHFLLRPGDVLHVTEVGGMSRKLGGGGVVIRLLKAILPGSAFGDDGTMANAPALAQWRLPIRRAATRPAGRTPPGEAPEDRQALSDLERLFLGRFIVSNSGPTSRPFTSAEVSDDDFAKGLKDKENAVWNALLDPARGRLAVWPTSAPPKRAEIVADIRAAYDLAPTKVLNRPPHNAGYQLASGTPYDAFFGNNRVPIPEADGWYSNPSPRTFTQQVTVERHGVRWGSENWPERGWSLAEWEASRITFDFKPRISAITIKVSSTGGAPTYTPPVRRGKSVEVAILWPGDHRAPNVDIERATDTSGKKMVLRSLLPEGVVGTPWLLDYTELPDLAGRTGPNAVPFADTVEAFRLPSEHVIDVRDPTARERATTVEWKDDALLIRQPFTWRATPAKQQAVIDALGHYATDVRDWEFEASASKECPRITGLVVGGRRVVVVDAKDAVATPITHRITSDPDRGEAVWHGDDTACPWVIGRADLAKLTPYDVDCVIGLTCDPLPGMRGKR